MPPRDTGWGGGWETWVSETEGRRERERFRCSSVRSMSMHDATRPPRDVTGRPIPYRHMPIFDALYAPEESTHRT